MGNNECIRLDSCPLSLKPVLYKLYVDDSLLLFRLESHIQLFNCPNSQRLPIKLTYEVECVDRIFFLDVKVEEVDQELETGLFRKDTFTDP